MLSIPSSNGWRFVNDWMGQWSFPYPSAMHGCVPPLWMNDGNWAGQDRRGDNYMNSFFYDCYGRPALYPNSMCFDPHVAARIGEAKNPGPFRISALNIQSLHCALNENKLVFRDNDVLALSETCATTTVLDKASKVSAACGRHAFCSNPVRRRTFKRGTISEGRGESAGVWVSSTMHARSLCLPWPDDIAALCRACDSILYTPNGPVYVACLYGYHQGFPDASPQTDRILEAIFQRSQLLKIPAVVVGDFNSTLENLPVWPMMCERGWCDAAIRHQEATGVEPIPTFKEVSRIDFIIMNDLAKRAFIKYEASEMPVSDHRMISAEFDWQRCQGLATVFKMPRDLMQLGIEGKIFEEARVPITLSTAFESAIDGGSIDDAWTLFTSAMEQVATNVASIHGQGQGRIPRSFLGKNRCKFIRVNQVAPVPKKGRDDAFQAQIDDCGVKLRQRITQIRRFDAIIAQFQAPNPLPRRRQQAIADTWNAVLGARGFAPCFASWFIAEVGTPCPLDVPQCNVVRWMREQLACRVPAWRNLYNNTRIRHIRQSFEDDWSKGGKLFHRALKGEQMPPVDAIDRQDILDVQLLRSRTKALISFRPLHEDLQLVSIGQKWLQDQAEGHVSSVEHGVVKLRVVRGKFRSGQVIAATTCHHPEHALQLAADYWSQFWTKPCQVDCSSQVIQDVVSSLPKMPPIGTEITMTELKNALKSLPVSKARGMDAISNWEIKHMCPDLQSMLLKILNRINATSEWPQPLTRARMHLIRKTREPGDITSTRPICILPNVYRLWGKIMTAKCFRHIKSIIPPSICGSVPGRSSIDLAMQLQSELEESIIQGTPLYGAALDLSKAFNTLSRPLLAELCHRLGLGAIWTPYAHFLHSLQRYFTLKQCWSMPLTSNTGVPEGCPLSVVMMLVMTWGVTNVLLNHFPDRVMHSYVDDWTLRDSDPGSLVDQMVFAHEITRAMGLSLSLRKTIPYATTAPARKTLARILKQRDLPSHVHDSGPCLGTQFQARAAKVTDMREQRVLDTSPKLKKLKVMPWSRTKKASLLLTGIFPAMFYGCEFHDMGLHWISHQRSLCNGAVWRDKPYLSHFLTPILSVDPQYEPWIWILRRIFLSYRRMLWLRPDKSKALWNLAVHRPSNKHTVGPTTILLAHLRRLGWVLKDNFECETMDGHYFALDKISVSQFKTMTLESWQTWLVPKLRTKLSMPDLTGFDVKTSCWQTKNPQEEGFLATLRSGGLFTNKVKSRIACSVSPNCQLCGALDGMTHRAYFCPASQEFREKHSLQHLQHVPRSCLVWGLFDQPKAAEQFYKAMDEIEIPDLPQLSIQNGPVSLFTDGSCSQPGPGRSSERYAAYAVRQARDQTNESNLVASGILPGRKQTPFRAELFACMVAMSVSLDATIYTDCRAVFLGITRLQREGWCELAWLSSPDMDLWRVAWNILRHPRRLQIVWLGAHRSINQAHSANDAWQIFHNALTDKSASVSTNRLPSTIRAIHDGLILQNSDLEKLRGQIIFYLKGIWNLHASKEAVSGSAAPANA